MSRRKETEVAGAGLFRLGGVELPALPAINATTVLAPRIADLAPLDDDGLARAGSSPEAPFTYGSVGTPSTDALARAVARLEGGKSAVLTPSGQSAAACALQTLLRAGDHLLAADTLTYATRWYIDRCLVPMGVAVTYYPPDLGGDVRAWLTPRTRVLLMESPGAFTFEVQDVPTLCRAAREAGVVAVLDNTWAASHFFDAFAHGVDVSLLSLTKNHAGAAGVTLGALVTTDPGLHGRLKATAALLGLAVSPDACSRAALAVTSLGARLRQQDAATAAVRAFLVGRPEVAAVLHPSLPGAAGHDLWRRDFTGSGPLISVAFRGWSRTRLSAFADALRVVRLGYGWGGAVSLAAIFEPDEWRTASRSGIEGPCLRLYLGLEHPDDLVEDLDRAFAASAG